MKICTRCGLAKNESEFYWLKARETYGTRCKTCNKECTMEWRERNMSKYRNYQNTYFSTPGGKEKWRKASTKYAKVHPDKVKTRYEAREALRKGQIKAKGMCEDAYLGECSGKLTMHHENHKKAKKVVFVCVRHHHDRDIKLRTNKKTTCKKN